jgi:hypothetical protein
VLVAAKLVCQMEPSEEARLGLARLLLVAVAQGGRALLAYGAELQAMLQVLLADPYHEVAYTACDVLVALNGAGAQAAVA